MLYEPLLKSNLAAIARAYAKFRGLSLTTVARRFCGDDQFFIRILENGCTFSVLQYDRIVSRFAEGWPEGLDWPADIPRPNKRQIATAKERVPTSRSKSWA